MDFALLQERLVAHIRQRVRSGEWTERGLARVAGVSQPHLHNVLKGARLLSTDTADQLLHHLHIHVEDLLEETAGGTPSGVTAALAGGSLGPGHPFPDLDGVEQRLPLWQPGAGSVAEPVLVRLAADPGMAGLFGAGDIALLERAERHRRQPEPGCYYAVDLGGEGRVHCGNYISTAAGNILELVKAKVVWIGRNLEPPRFVARSSEKAGR